MLAQRSTVETMPLPGPESACRSRSRINGVQKVRSSLSSLNQWKLGPSEARPCLVSCRHGLQQGSSRRCVGPRPR